MYGACWIYIVSNLSIVKWKCLHNELVSVHLQVQLLVPVAESVRLYDLDMEIWGLKPDEFFFTSYNIYITKDTLFTMYMPQWYVIFRARCHYRKQLCEPIEDCE